jgi:DNA-binding winged helix-turn-helix (wHTH) protein
VVNSSKLVQIVPKFDLVKTTARRRGPAGRAQRTRGQDFRTWARSGQHISIRGLPARPAWAVPPNRAGVLWPVAIGGRALDLLELLVERHGEVLSKVEIMAFVWPKAVVEEGNLTLQISALRRIHDRGRSGGSCIQTVARRGYRFAAAVTAIKAEASRAAEAISRGRASPLPRLSIVVLPLTNLSNDPEGKISPMRSRRI